MFWSFPCQKAKHPSSLTFCYTSPKKLSFSSLSSQLWKNRFDNCGKKLYFFQDTDLLLFPNNTSHMTYQCLLFLPRLPGNSQLPLRLRPARFSPSGGPVLLFLCSMYHVSSTECVCAWRGRGAGLVKKTDRKTGRGPWIISPEGCWDITLLSSTLSTLSQLASTGESSAPGEQTLSTALPNSRWPLWTNPGHTSLLSETPPSAGQITRVFAPTHRLGIIRMCSQTLNQ